MANGGHYVEAIRCLHQTVVSLRGALQASRDELDALRERERAGSQPSERLEHAVAALSVENSKLRQQLLARTPAATDAPPRNLIAYHSKRVSVNVSLHVAPQQQQKMANKEEDEDAATATDNDDDTMEEREGDTCDREGSRNVVFQQSPSADLNDQEVDNIELIFTHEDTNDAGNLKEPLISIEPPTSGGGGGGGTRKPSDFEPTLSADISDRELEDDVFNDNFENENQENANFQSHTHALPPIYASRSDNSINHDDPDEARSMKSFYSSFQDSSFENKSMEKDESFDRFEERVRYLETDISKVGIHDVEYAMGRRNTCPNPLQYRPMMHREALRGLGAGGVAGGGSRKAAARPILQHSHAARRESGAQTDISALPGSGGGGGAGGGARNTSAGAAWRSESSLAHKVKIGEHFTTLPSKYPMPGSRLRPSEKTVEARRILLSDIGFTSMVPELSRSADHLCPTNLKTCPLQYGQFLKTTDLYSPGYSQNEVWSSTSPSCRHSQSRYSSLFPLPSPLAPGAGGSGGGGAGGGHVSRRCSAPVSPCRKGSGNAGAQRLAATARVRFANGSLPELRSEWHHHHHVGVAAGDSGDSTDSLVDEAEQYLRRSIDCITSGAGSKDATMYGGGGGGVLTKTGARRASAPEPGRDNVPPQGWQPFLPRLPRDLRLDYWVKVISPEGRVRGGRVRYVGHLLSQSEQFVGVQLSMPDGNTDGAYNNRRYFQCEPNHGIFVPFRKVIMGWKP